MHLDARLLNFQQQVKERIMLLITVLVVATAVVFCLALAASSSPVYGFNAKSELAALNESSDGHDAAVDPKQFVTTHQGVSTESQPIVSAAGMQ
jgi:hypothetical protein